MLSVVFSSVMASTCSLFPPWTPTRIVSLKLSSLENSKPCASLKIVNSSFFKYPLASKIMVRNLPYSTSVNKLQEEFSRFGQISEVKLAKDEATNKSKGYAFIQYTSQEDALLALENMDQKYFDGRAIFVEIAKPRKTDFGRYPIASGPPDKQQVLSQDEVGNEEHNVNGSDT